MGITLARAFKTKDLSRFSYYLPCKQLSKTLKAYLFYPCKAKLICVPEHRDNQSLGRGHSDGDVHIVPIRGRGDSKDQDQDLHHLHQRIITQEILGDENCTWHLIPPCCTRSHPASSSLPNPTFSSNLSNPAVPLSPRLLPREPTCTFPTGTYLYISHRHLPVHDLVSVNHGVDRRDLPQRLPCGLDESRHESQLDTVSLQERVLEMGVGVQSTLS